mgnify:CR=1 FL=1
MATTIIKQFSRKETRNYVVVDRQKFEEEAESRLMALGAAALLHWIDLIKAQFSSNTAARYIESIYLDTGNPRQLSLGIVPSTLASILEGGQPEHVLNPFFLKSPSITKGRYKRDGSPASDGRGGLSEKGKRYKRIPVKRTGTYISSKKEPNLSIAAIDQILERQSPRTAKFMIGSAVANFSRTNVATHTYTPSGFFIQDAHPEFRTITPEKTWTHPGIAPALLLNQVATWTEGQRAQYAAPILGGDAGIELPGGILF